MDYRQNPLRTFRDEIEQRLGKDSTVAADLNDEGDLVVQVEGVSDFEVAANAVVDAWQIMKERHQLTGGVAECVIRKRFPAER